MRPLVIAHRGASGHRPELTLEAFALALRLGADSIELDLVPTRDGVLVCRHDLELSRTTDVASHPELAGRRRTIVVDGLLHRGWFVHDLTFEELRSLRCVERWPAKRPSSAAHDGRSVVPTFAEVLELVEAEAGRRGRPVRVHAELKHPAFVESLGHSLPELVDDVRHPYVTWMSFDATVLRRLHLRGRDRLVQLYERRPRGRHLAAASTYASGVGVRRKVVLPKDDAGRVDRPTDFVAKAHRRDLDVLVWTHRAENEHLPRNLRVGRDPHGHGQGQLAAEMLFEAGIDALITDFPELGVAAREAFEVGLPIAR
ncbi:glycerophosphodiester phosphodiesterase family protein [Nocardioides mangrovicus]|uniref:glycerophosphodiester phosphodiesterase family protein n=1 Tax=Nocardioides mangrovicus TaxID=2478913 RepID=UPI001313F5C8|nr:glycerophosphodiester phosphodiesterase family protein [Nocardioides mangrovicus]